MLPGMDPDESGLRAITLRRWGIEEVFCQSEAVQGIYILFCGGIPETGSERVLFQLAVVDPGSVPVHDGILLCFRGRVRKD